MFRRIKDGETQECFVYFKFSGRRDGGKGPSSAEGALIQRLPDVVPVVFTEGGGLCAGFLDGKGGLR